MVRLTHGNAAVLFSASLVGSTAAVPAWPIQDGYDRLPVMWFGANETGLDNATTLELISRHRVAGYGWQQGMGGTDAEKHANLGNGEVNLAAAVTHLADYLAKKQDGQVNKTLTFVYRQNELALSMFGRNRMAVSDPRNGEFWVRNPMNSSEACLWQQPWGTHDPAWNFSNARAVDYWIDSVIDEVAAEARWGVGAVFFDETDQGYCGRWNQPNFAPNCPKGLVNETVRELQAGNNAALARQVVALNAKNIIPILSSNNRFVRANRQVQAEAPCALPEDKTVAAIKAAGGVYARFYEGWPRSPLPWEHENPDLNAAMIENALIEAKHGIPAIMHTGGPCLPDALRPITRPGRLGGHFEWLLGTFLIVQTPHTVLSMSNRWYDKDFCWRSEFDVQYGRPLGDAVRLSPYVWARNFTHCTVHVDTQAHRGEIYLL